MVRTICGPKIREGCAVNSWLKRLDVSMRQLDSREDEQLADNARGGGGISLNTPVALGLIVALSMGLAGAIWWAGNWTGSMQSKIDQILASINSVALSDKTQNEEIAQLKSEVEVLKRVGSPALQHLGEQLTDVKRLIELHIEAQKAKDANRGNVGGPDK